MLLRDSNHVCYTQGITIEFSFTNHYQQRPLAPADDTSTDDHLASTHAVLVPIPASSAQTTPRPLTCSPDCRVVPCISGPSSLAYSPNSCPSTFYSSSTSTYTHSNSRTTWPGSEYEPRPRKVTRAAWDYPKLDRHGNVDKGKRVMVWDEPRANGRYPDLRFEARRSMVGAHTMNYTGEGRRWDHDVA
jgi:hypothetical protein